MRKLFSFFRELDWLIAIVRDNWPWLVAAYSVLAGGPILLLWRYVQMTANNVGWWVYPLFVFLVVLAPIGAWFLLLALRGKVIIPGARFASMRKTKERALQASDDAKRLSGLVFEIISENESVSPTTPGLDTDEWRRRNLEREERKRKALRKHMSEIVGVVEVARNFCEIGKRDPLWGYEHRPDELAKFLAELSVKLKNAAEEM